jgi:RNA polymerase sigma factor (sigma-70 family)
MGATLSTAPALARPHSHPRFPEPLRAAPQIEHARAHLPRMLLVARRILGSEDLAWDAVQESLILLWHEAHAPHDLVGWLVRTVVHRSLHQARSLRRRRRHEERGGERTQEHDDDPSRAAQLAELAQCVERALGQLPEPFQSTLRLRDVDGLEYEHIAQRLALPIGTVRSRLHRARALLRPLLAELVHESAGCWICELDSRL